MDSLGFAVPCGRCIACKVNRRSAWSLRLQHEAPYHDKTCFVTLTYDDEHLNSTSVSKRDLQLFIKRLRKSIEPEKIKYFGCGEYGDNYGRPHYHLILFGLGLSDEELIFDAWKDENKLPYGFIYVKPCVIQTINYVCGYITKKIISKENVYYKNLGIEPPFQLQSKGLGLQFAIDNRKLLETKGKMRSGSSFVPVNRYYRTKLDLDLSEATERAREGTEQAIDAVELRHGQDLSVGLYLVKTGRTRAAYLDALQESNGLYDSQNATNEAMFSQKKRGKL